MLLAWYTKQNLKNKLSLILLLSLLLVVGILGLYFEYFLRSNYTTKAQQQIDFAFHRISTHLKLTEDKLKKGIVFIQDDEMIIASLELINTYQDKNNYNVFLIDEEKKSISQQLLEQVKLSFNDSIALYDTNQDLIAYVIKTSEGYRLHFISYENQKLTLYSRLESEDEFYPIPAQFPRLVPYHHTSDYKDKNLYAKGVIYYYQENDELVVTVHKTLLDRSTRRLFSHIEMSNTVGKKYFEELSKDLNMVIYPSSNIRFKKHAFSLRDGAKCGRIMDEGKVYRGCTHVDTKDGILYILGDLDKTFELDSLYNNRIVFGGIILFLTVIAVIVLQLLFNREVAIPLQGLMKQIKRIKNQDYDTNTVIRTGDELELISNSMNKLSQTVRDRETMLTSMLELSPIAVRIAKNKGSEVVFSNSAYKQLIEAENSIGTAPQHYYANPQEYLDMIAALDQNTTIHNRLVQLTIQGQTKWALASYMMIEYMSEAMVLGWFYDITHEREVTERLNFALEGANDGLWDWNMQTDEVYYSPRWLEMLGYQEDEFPHTLETWGRLVNPEDKERALADVSDYLEGKSDKFEIEFRMKHKDGHWVDILSRARLAKDDNGTIMEPHRLVGTHVDISDRKKFENRIKEQKQEFETIFNLSKDGIAILDLESNFLDFNNAYLEMTGFTREELLTKSCIGLTIPEDIPRTMDALKIVMKNGSLNNYEKTCLVKDGKRVIINMGIILMPDKHRLLVTAKDITEMKEHEHQLERIAHYDSLTGLPNRVLNADRLRQAMLHALRRHERIAVLYLDLDGFKEVNDRYGHATGDKLLTIIASQMQQELRETDTLSRLGGDEFVAILGDLNENIDPVAIIERLLHAANKMVMLDDMLVQVSASIGVAFYPQQEDIDADQLIRQADQAMYEAKQSGKNRYYIFDSEHDRTVRSQHEKIDEIRQALEDNQFVLYYQPKVNMRTHTFTGVEALIRWVHPEKGLIPPLDFLPFIEDHPLAIDVGEWVIDEVLSQIGRWNEEGMDIKVSVNVGARQLLSGNFVGRLREILNHHPKIDPSKLEIEILETSALENINQASLIMEECKTMGIDFAVDDFGTGYSSLSYLKMLPISIIKIDQSFVRDMLQDKNDLAILEGIISLASAFERTVIAEGVETEAHCSMLLNLGCDWGQGYGIARPMPAGEVIVWFNEWGKSL